jgi:antibiotic biosynthesis monooxygenase (ABM) superfamily enzyme
VQVIRPIAETTPTYTIIIRFETKENLLDWMQSPDRRRLIEKVQPMLVDDDRFQVLQGWDFWFTPPGAKTKLPTRWKQFLLTWSAIFPLVLLVPLLIVPLLQALGLPASHYLNMLFVTAAVTALMTYVVMPHYTKLVHKWLFK